MLSLSNYAGRPVAFLLRYVQRRPLAHTAILLAVLGAVGCSVSTQYAVKFLVDTLDKGRTHPGINVSLVMPGLVATEFARHARGSTGPVPPGAIGSPMKPQTAEDVATMVADIIDHPVAEVYTNPASQAVAARYFSDVALFESEAEIRS